MLRIILSNSILSMEDLIYEPNELNSTLEKIFTDVDYVETSGIFGGDITYSNSPALQWVLVSLLVIVCIWLIYNIYWVYDQRQPVTYNQRMAHTHFNNLHGDTFDDDAKQAIHFGEMIEDPTAIDHYRMGTVYLVNAHDPHRAHVHFNHALNQVINGAVNVRDAPFILDRIDDYKDEFLNFPDIDELPIQQALMAHFDAMQKIVETSQVEKPNIATDDPDFTQKVILSRQTWLSDSQNVHDSAVGTTIKDQFMHVRSSNAQIANLQTKNFADMCGWLKIRYADDKPAYEKLMQVFVFFDHNYTVGSIPDVHEQDILVAIWQRIHDPQNSNRYNQLREALGGAIMDCVEGSHVVCMAGRNAKVWQTLTHLDFNPAVGIIKNKQTLRNEVYERAAKIVDDHVGSESTSSSILKDSYRNSENTEQVKELIECIKDRIDELYNEFRGLLPETQLRMLLEECKAVV
jgi:hypothetical protein